MKGHDIARPLAGRLLALLNIVVRDGVGNLLGVIGIGVRNGNFNEGDAALIGTRGHSNAPQQILILVLPILRRVQVHIELELLDDPFQAGIGQHLAAQSFQRQARPAIGHEGRGRGGDHGKILAFDNGNGFVRWRYNNANRHRQYETDQDRDHHHVFPTEY